MKRLPTALWTGLAQWVRRAARHPPDDLAAPASDGSPARLQSLFWLDVGAVAHARLWLAFGNALVLYLEPIPLAGGTDYFDAPAYVIVLLMIAYAFWVWRHQTSRTQWPSLWRLTPWLDALFSAALIWSTGGYKSPFIIWNVFTIVGCALKNGWRTSVRVSVGLIVLYTLICMAGVGRPDFLISVFLVETSYLFVIALVLAYMGQRLVEQNRVLLGLYTAEAHMTAGRSVSDILGRIADSLIELLQVEQVAVAAWEGSLRSARRSFVNLDRRQGQRLLRLARDCLAFAPRASGPFSIVSNEAASDPRFQAAGEAMGGVHSLLITRLPGSRDATGVLVACNRLGGCGFSRSDRDLAELLAAQAGPILESARLQEQRRYHAGMDERRRIAAELHDGLIQTLASIDLRILNCSNLCRNRQWETLGEELLLLKLIAEEALREGRAAINELAPVRLREEGLAVYLEDCIRRFQDGTSIPVEATVELGTHEIPEPTALLLIGLLREGLNNIRKHAQATQVTCAIRRRAETISFELADNGVGFCVEESAALHEPTRHFGLAYLRERLTAVSGVMRLTSAPGAGTVLEARVPVLTEERLAVLLAEAEV